MNELCPVVLLNEEVIKPHTKVPSNSKCFQFMKENTMYFISVSVPIIQL